MFYIDPDVPQRLDEIGFIAAVVVTVIIALNVSVVRFCRRAGPRWEAWRSRRRRH